MNKKALIYISITLLILGVLFYIVRSLGVVNEFYFEENRSFLWLVNVLFFIRLILLYIIVKDHKGMKLSIVPLIGWAVFFLSFNIIDILRVRYGVSYVSISQVYLVARIGFGVSVIAFSLFLILSKELGKRKWAYLTLGIMNILVILYFNFVSPMFSKLFTVEEMSHFFRIQTIVSELITGAGWLLFYITELNQKEKLELLENFEESNDLINSLDEDDFRL